MNDQMSPENQMSPETRFERRLRADLESFVAERGAEQAARTVASELPAKAAWRRRGPRLGLATVAAAAVATGVLVVSAGGGDTPAAFAVELQPQGKVSVEVSSLEDPVGLEKALEEAGIPASVTYLASGTVCKEPRFQAAPSTAGEGGALISGPTGGGGPLDFTIGRGDVGPGQTLVVTAWPGPGVLLLGGAQVKVAEGTVAPCEPVPASPAGE